MQTSLKTGFAQIFSGCPKNLGCPKFGGAAAPLAPPRPVRLWLTKLYFHVNFSSKISIVLTPNMATLSRGCKPRMLHSLVSSI